MEIEHVAGVGLAAGGTTENQGDLAVGYGLLREVIVDDECVLASVTEEFTNGCTGHGGVVLQSGAVCCRSRYNDGVV